MANAAAPAPAAPEGQQASIEKRTVNVKRDPTGEIQISVTITSPEGTSVKVWRATSLPDLKANQPEGYEAFVEFLKGEVATRARQRALARARQQRAADPNALPEGDLETDLPDENAPPADDGAKRLPPRHDAAVPRFVPIPQTSAAWPSNEAQPRQIQADIGGGRIDIRDAVDGTISINWRPRTGSAGEDRTWIGNSLEKLKAGDPQLAEWYLKLSGGTPAVVGMDNSAQIPGSGLSVIGLFPPPPPPEVPEEDRAPVPVTEVGGLPLEPVRLVPFPAQP
jgi:hypothetical protein